MSQSDRAIKKLATELARLKSEVVSWRGAQADYTSIEAGTMDINDSDGNLVSRVGFQEDGSGAVRFFDGPVPPVPSGVTASADGPIIQATWDGSFVDGAEATYDLAYLEVAATLVDDASNVSFATITAKEGASASVVADVTGDWVVAVRSVSQAGKKSEFATAGTVEVKLTDVAGAIEAVQDSANGKNKVTYSDRPPTPDDPGIFDDTWFVGQVGRPNDGVEATNHLTNPSFESVGGWFTGGGTLTYDTGFKSRMWDGQTSGSTIAQVAADGSSSYLTLTQHATTRPRVTPGQWVGVAVFVAHDPSDVLGVRSDVVCSGSATTWHTSGDFVPSPFYAGRRIVYAFQVPASATRAQLRVQMYSGSAASIPAGRRMWVDDAVMVVAESEAEALAAVATYFDGDTPSGATDNEPHYRWTGTPHASTSEKYLPALDIGDSDNWNVIEQYRHDGTGWVKVELSHHVFSTVDLGKATVGELDGIRIMARTITGDLFSGDAFDGLVFRGNTFVTRDGNGEFSDRGLFFQKPDGTAIFRVPTDGTAISMSASDVQIERAQVDELELNVGRVRSGGLFELSSGVTPPASPPELNSAWQRFTTLPPPAERSDTKNLAYWGNGGSWVRAINVLGTGEGDRIEIYDFDTGELVRMFEIGVNPQQGITVIGDNVYVFGEDHDVLDRVFIFGYDLNTGERVSRHEYTRSIGAKNALGNDGTNLIVASVWKLELWVHRRDPVTGVQVGPDMRSGANSWPASGSPDLFGVSIDGDEVTVVPEKITRVYTNSGGVLTRKTDSSEYGFAGWANPGGEAAGAAWVDGVPYMMDAGGKVYAGSEFDTDVTVQACFTWWDGAHETTPSAIAASAVGTRESVTVSVPTRAGLQKRVYYRPGSSGTWNRVDLAEPETSLILSSVALGLYQTPTVNSFPNADPATFQSTNGNVVVRGDGSGKWGPLTFNADGTMTSTQIPEWVPITTFKTGFGPQSWGYAPAYRVWPDGKVEWRGIVAGTIGDGQTPLFTIPAEVRPAQPAQFAAGTSYSSFDKGSTARMEFGKPGEMGTASAYEGSESRSWISMDGIYYYIN